MLVMLGLWVFMTNLIGALIRQEYRVFMALGWKAAHMSHIYFLDAFKDCFDYVF